MDRSVLLFMYSQHVPLLEQYAAAGHVLPSNFTTVILRKNAFASQRKPQFNALYERLCQCSIVLGDALKALVEGNIIPQQICEQIVLHALDLTSLADMSCMLFR